MDSFDKARWNTGVDLSGSYQLDATRLSIAYLMSHPDIGLLDISELEPRVSPLLISVSDRQQATWDNRATITPDFPAEVECRYCQSPVPLTRTHCGACGAPRKVMA